MQRRRALESHHKSRADQQLSNLRASIYRTERQLREGERLEVRMPRGFAGLGRGGGRVLRKLLGKSERAEMESDLSRMRAAADRMEQDFVDFG